MKISNKIYLVELKRYIKECEYFGRPIEFKIAKHLLQRYREMC